MNDLIKAWKVIVAIAADRKVSKDEVPLLIDAIVTILKVIGEWVSPFLSVAGNRQVSKIVNVLKIAKT